MWARAAWLKAVPPFRPPEPTRRDEVTWLQPCPDALLEGLPDTAPGPEARYHATETVELAFVTALQRMPPRQAAALLLRDVLGFSGGEVAGMLGTSATAVKGVLRRARGSLDAQRGRSPARPASPGERALSRRFADAYLAADVDGLVALLTDGAWLSMPPAPHQYQGATAIAAFWRASFAFRGGRPVYLLPARANSQPAFGSYLGDGTGPARPAGLIVRAAACRSAVD